MSKMMPAVPGILVAVTALAAAFVAGYLMAPQGVTEITPIVVSTPAPENVSPPEASVPPPAVLTGELERLKHALAKATAQRVALEEEIAALKKDHASYEWVRTQILEDKIYMLSSLGVQARDLGISEPLAGFLALTDEQKAGMQQASDQLLSDLKAWESVNAQFDDSYTEGVRINIPAPPTEYGETYMAAAQRILDEDDFTAYRQLSKSAYEKLGRDFRLTATIKELGDGREELTLRQEYLRNGEYKFSGSSSSNNGVGHSEISPRWRHLLESPK